MLKVLIIFISIIYLLMSFFIGYAFMTEKVKNKEYLFASLIYLYGGFLSLWFMKFWILILTYFFAFILKQIYKKL